MGPTPAPPAARPIASRRFVRFFLRAAAGLLVAISLWLTAGELALTGATTAVRLGGLAPLWLLASAAVAAVIAFVWRGSPAVLAACLVALLPALPWLPMALPAAVFVWRGPLAWLTWVACAASLLVQASGHVPLSWVRRRSAASALAFAIALVVYLGGYTAVRAVLPAGDEPHYLIISQSLLADGDLAIDDNHARGEYAPFHAGELRPDFLRRGLDGRIYSVHAPGLAVLLLPAYALAGYPGAVVFLACLAAAGAWLLWRLAFDFTGDAGAAWFAWAGAALGVPFVFHAFTIFPDAPASVLALVGLRALLVASGLLPSHAPPSESARPMTVSHAAVAGAALAVLPWMHTRYALVSGLLGLFIVAHLWWRGGHGRAIAAFAALPVASAAGWFAFFQIVYGTPSPAAPYGGYTQTAVSHVPVGVLGLLADQQFGLLATAPVFTFAVVGLWRLVRGPGAPAGRGLLGLELGLLALAYLLVAGAYRMWWGGASAPARFLVVLVLPLGLALAAAWAWARRPATRALAAAALLVSLAATAVFLVAGDGSMAYNVRDGVARWTLWAAPGLDLARGLPSLHHGPPGTALMQVGIWAAAFWLAWLALVALRRVPWARHLALPLTAIAFMAALAAAWQVADAKPVGSGVGALRLLDRLARRPSTTAVRYDRAGGGSRGWHRVEDPLPYIRLTGRAVGSGSRAAIEMPALAPGRYRVDVLGAGTSPVAVRFGGAPPLATLDAQAPGPPRALRSIDLFFPVAVPPWLVIPLAPTASLPSVIVQPMVLGAPVGVPAVPATHVAGYGRVQAFFLDNLTYPEPGGFWVRPGAVARVVVAQAEGRTPVSLHLRSAALQNAVRLRVGTWEEVVTFTDGEERQAIAPPPGAARSAVLEIQASRGRRPIDTDRSSRDARLLGVWVSFE